MIGPGIVHRTRRGIAFGGQHQPQAQGQVFAQGEAFWRSDPYGVVSQGDFAALVQQGNVAEAIAAQAQSPLADAADAWQETRHTMDNVKSGVERFLALMFALLSGLLCVISVTAVIGYVWDFPAVDWGLLAFYAALGCVTAWFTRAQWRDFRGQK